MPAKSKRSRRANKKDAVLDRTTLILVGVAVVVIAITAGALLFTQQQSNVPSDFVPQYTGGPRIEVAATVIDHGDVQFNYYVESTFEIQNVGDSPLQLDGQPQVVLMDGC